MLVLKLGGSYITYKRMDYTVPLREIELTRSYPIKHSLIKRIGTILKEKYSGEMIIVHGGGTHGHRTVRRWRENVSRQDPHMMPWEVRYRMDQLTEQVMRSLGEAGLPVYPVDPPDIILANDGAIENFDATAIQRLLERGMVPVLRGDLVPDLAHGWSVVSGDDIMVRLVDLSNSSVLPVIDRAIMCMEAPGFYSGHGSSKVMIEKLDRELFHASYQEWHAEKGDVVQDESGGIFGKLMCAHMISARGIETHLIGDSPANLNRLLEGEKAGTSFTPFDGDKACKNGSCAGITGE